ncbi:MAG: hypothetical protein J2P17_19020 [Mycobacterium sp.]|nr:hypothetical protein [Mycobacterium sp.]
MLVNDGGGGLPRQLPSVGDHVEVDREALRNIAKRLQADLDGLKGWGSGSIKDFQENDAGRVDEDALGDYPAGHQIARTFESANSQIGSTYQQFISNYEQVINAINQQVNAYQRAEDATQEAAYRANTGGGQPSGNQSGGGQQW